MGGNDEDFETESDEQEQKQEKSAEVDESYRNFDA